MALCDDWVQSLLTYEVTLESPADSQMATDSGNIGRCWIDGVLVVYDLEDIPAWLAKALADQDEDGQTTMAEPRTHDMAVLEASSRR